MNHEQVKATLLDDPATRTAYEQPPLILAVARAVVERRRSIGMTQDELAGVLGTSQTQIGRIESGQANITLNTLERLARALGTSVHQLIGV